MNNQPSEEENPDVFDSGLEPFGGEESYWTMYRMFAADPFRGTPRSMAEVWDILALNYDLSAEDMASIEATLLEWREDIQQDIGKRGIAASLLPYGNGYVLAERVGPVESWPQPEKPVQRPVAPAPVKIAALAVEVEDTRFPIEILKDRIESILSTTYKARMQQPALKKALIEAWPEDNADFLQGRINELVQKGELFKGKVGHSTITWISLQPFENEKDTPVENIEKDSEKEIDVSLQLGILEVLCAPGTQVSQRHTLNSIWRTMHGIETKSQAVPRPEIEKLKQAVKVLRVAGLVEGGGVKNRRSSTHVLFKVCLTSQEVKEELQDILANPRAEALLLARILENGTR